MYVCLCKGVTCSAIRSAVSEQGIGSLRELSRNLGVATQCGKCAHSAKQVLNEALGSCCASSGCPGQNDVAA